MLLLIPGLVLLAFLAWMFLRRKKTALAEVQSAPLPARPLPDEDDAERRQVDTSTLQAARAAVISVIPDAVLADALQHTDVRGLAQAFADVDAAVLTAAIGDSPEGVRKASQEELQQLSGAGQAVDDLDIWSFGES